MAGHVSKDMVKHYSHIRTEAKRRAVEKLVAEPVTIEESGSEQVSEPSHKKSHKSAGRTDDETL
jgi:hypothetical protein